MRFKMCGCIIGTKTNGNYFCFLMRQNKSTKFLLACERHHPLKSACAVQISLRKKMHSLSSCLKLLHAWVFAACYGFYLNFFVSCINTCFVYIHSSRYFVLCLIRNSSFSQKAACCIFLTPKTISVHCNSWWEFYHPAQYFVGSFGAQKPSVIQIVVLSFYMITCPTLVWWTYKHPHS